MKSAIIFKQVLYPSNQIMSQKDNFCVTPNELVPWKFRYIGINISF